MDSLQHELDRLEALSSEPNFWDNQEAAQKTLQKRAAAEQKLTTYAKLVNDIGGLQELLELASDEGDSEIIEEISVQLPELGNVLRGMELRRMLSGSEDGSDAILTVHPGAGGVDAQDWAEMLVRMYLRWCEQRGFKTEIVDHTPGDEAGIKSVSFVVRGEFAYGYLRAEGGVHRLIRISPFDSNARRHTAFAAVFVVPDLDDDESEIEVRDEDLRVDTYRASGAGGQHVNKTESAVRLTHIPSGIVVQCQSERSQHKNRATAMKMLRGRLYEQQRREREAEFEENYGSDKQDIAFGSQVRTYTLNPYMMVKDERTELKVSNAQGVLDGELDPFIEAYLMMAADKKNVGKADQES